MSIAVEHACTHFQNSISWLSSLPWSCNSSINIASPFAIRSRALAKANHIIRYALNNVQFISDDSFTEFVLY